MALKMDNILQSAVALAGKPTKKSDGSWPSPEAGEWPSVTAIAVCATKGCPVEGIGFQNTLYIQVDGSLLCVCGQCGEYISDLRGDLTPVGQDKLDEYRRDPKLFNEMKDAFKKRKK